MTFVYWRLFEWQALSWEWKGRTALVLKAQGIAWRMCVIHQGSEEGKASSQDDFSAEVTLIWVLRDNEVSV